MDTNEENWVVECSDDEKYEVDSKVSLKVFFFQRIYFCLINLKIENSNFYFLLTTEWLGPEIRRYSYSH